MTNASNPFLVYNQTKIDEYKLPVASLYKKTIEEFNRTTQKPKQKVFNNLTKLLQESYFVGSTKFGNNFIS